ncbi:MAG: hypothetical protein PHS30_04705 [Bacteroidales bacterium]|nr:hypothetical protein [Bacteroidales bacterium]
MKTITEKTKIITIVFEYKGNEYVYEYQREGYVGLLNIVNRKMGASEFSNKKSTPLGLEILAELNGQGIITDQGIYESMATSTLQAQVEELKEENANLKRYMKVLTEEIKFVRRHPEPSLLDVAVEFNKQMNIYSLEEENYSIVKAQRFIQAVHQAEGRGE